MIIFGQVTLFLVMKMGLIQVMTRLFFPFNSVSLWFYILLLDLAVVVLVPSFIVAISHDINEKIVDCTLIFVT